MLYKNFRLDFMIQITPPQNPNYWISQRALTFSENDLENPNRVAVSLVAGTAIMVYEKGVIDYGVDGNFRKWTLKGYSTRLVEQTAHSIYARLSREEKDALIVFSIKDYNLDGSQNIVTGTDENGNDIISTTEPSDTYWYVKIGEITSTDGTTDRTLTYDSGALGTKKGEEETGGWNEMFDLNKRSTPWLITVKQMFDEFSVKNAITLLSGFIFKTSKGERKVSNVKYSTDSDNEYLIDENGTPIQDKDGNFIPDPQYVPSRDDIIPSAAYLQKYTSENFLSKSREDIALEKITFEKGIEVGHYESGTSGATIFTDSTGKTVGEMDKLYIRMKAYFETLEVINANSIGGKLILSPAGSVKCIGVQDKDDSGEVWNYYRCYFLAEQDGQTIQNRFKVKDQIYSQMFDGAPGESHNVSSRYFWRLCVNVSTSPVEFEGRLCHYIDLSKTDCDTMENDNTSDEPMVGDILNQRGNRDDLDRMNFVEMSTVDSSSPNITLYHGVNSYSLEGKAYVAFGVDKTTNKSFMKIYGDMYVGDRGTTPGSYLKYTEGKGLELCGTLSVNSKIGDKPITEAIKPEGYDEFVEAVKKELGGLQDQIDGKLDTYYYQYDPSLDNYPAMEWVTDDDKEKHLNDTFTNLESGQSWRWTRTPVIMGDGSEYYEYEWTSITDTIAGAALLAAGHAQDTADGKRRVFTVTPYPPYEKGDLWSEGPNAPLKICIHEKTTGYVFEEGDWDYADNTQKVVEALSGFNYLQRALHEDTTIDGGLIQTSLLQLGYTDTSGAKVVMSGTNGLYNSTLVGGGVASWWGGKPYDMIDYYDWNGTEWVPKSGVEIPSGIPSGLIRFDGTGYLAQGKLWWDDDGRIYADPTAMFLSFDVEAEAGTLSATILDLLDKQVEFEQMWSVKTDSKGVKYLFTTYPLVTQGDVTFRSDTEGLDLPTIYDEIPIDRDTIYWENGVLRAKGGGGTADSVSWGNVTDKPSWILDGKVQYSEVEGTPDLSVYAKTSEIPSLSGYATQEWVLGRGFLTSHQSIHTLTIKNSAGTVVLTYTPNAETGSLTLSKAMVGLGNVENTKLSTWAGSTSITTVGTITSGTWNGSKIANGYLANSSVSIAGNSVSLGGSLTAATLKTSLGLGSLAYKSSLVAADIPGIDWSKITSGKPTTLSGYGITDAKIANGTITLGTNTITPLTSHQAIYNLTLQAGSFSAVTFDPNGAAKTVNIPTTTSHISEGTNLYYTDARARASITGGATTVLTNNLTASRALVSNGNGKIAVSAVTSTELGYLDGVTSAIQTQLDAKVAIDVTQTITGEKNFTGGLKVNGQSISYSPTDNLWSLDGHMHLTGDLTFSSARALKNIIDQRSLTLEQLSVIKPTRFTWKDGRDNEIHAGGIADDVMTVIPEVVRKAADGTLSMNYSSASFVMAASLVDIVSDLSNQVRMLKVKIREMEEEIHRLKNNDE